MKKKLTAVAAAAALAVAIPLITHVRAADAPPSPAPATQPGGNLVTVTAPGALDPNTVVATAGTIQVTAGEVEAALNNVDPTQLVALPDHGRKAMTDQLVTMKLLEQAARKQHLEDQTSVKLQIDEVIARAMIQKMAQEKGADEKYYNDHKSDYAQLKVRYILFATAGGPVPGATLTDAAAKAKADGVKAQLDKGADFGKLAAENSDDKTSALSGGELPEPVTDDAQLDPVFIHTAFSLKKNEISQPVKTGFGYFIIQVEDSTDRPFEQVQRDVANHRVGQQIADLQKATPTTYNPAYIAGAATQPTTPPATTQPAK